jgi:hypothetical protein
MREHPERFIGRVGHDSAARTSSTAAARQRGPKRTPEVARDGTARPLLGRGI